MREVTIPEGWNPCKITVNNSIYEYPAGQTVEVPDEIAALIEQAAANQPQAKDQRQVFSIEFGPEDAGKPVAVNSDGTGVQLGGGYDAEIEVTMYGRSGTGVLKSGSYDALYKKIIADEAPNIRATVMGTPVYVIPAYVTSVEFGPSEQSITIEAYTFEVSSGSVTANVSITATIPRTGEAVISATEIIA